VVVSDDAAVLHAYSILVGREGRDACGGLD
jgi:hypothetical protein